MQKAPTSIFLFAAYPLWSETFLRQDLMFLQQSGCSVVGASLYGGDCEPQDDWPKVQVLSDGAQPHSTLARRRSIVGLMVRVLIPKRLYNVLSLQRHRAQIERLEAFAREVNATHIHAEFADLAALVASQVAKRLHITYSVGIHAFDIHASRFELSDILSDASAITVCNRAAMDACKKQFPQTADRLHYIPHGVNLDFWTLRGTEQSAPDALEILFVGRLVPKKGVRILLDALAILQSRSDSPKCHLTIVGDGPLRDELMQYTAELKVPVTCWAGVLSQNELKRLMSSMSCLCAPSVVTKDGDRDGIPNVILEAMATGLPVIASDVGSIPEVVTPETGWPVTDINPQKLAEALRSFVTLDNASRQKKTQKARHLIENRFNAKALAQERRRVFMREQSD